MMDKWDRFFLGLAQYMSTASKDPSTKVGAVIVRRNRTVAGLGFNGLPIGLEDTDERLNNRELKYKMIVHAEMNAIDFSSENLARYTLYTWPFLPCPVCAGRIIQNGISRVVAPPLPERLKERWGDDILLTKRMFFETGVLVNEVE